MNFLILAKIYTKDFACWWRPNAAGYTEDVSNAGRFTEAEARKVEEGSHGEHVAIPESDALAMPTRQVVNAEHAHKWLIENRPRTKRSRR